MKKIIHDFSTEVLLEADEAKNICRMGQGDKCCAFLVAGANGFECIRLSYPASAHIFDRLEKGTMNAKGKGGWKGCAWEGQLPKDETDA